MVVATIPFLNGTVDDKGISAGEQSTAKIENIEITDSKIGIASKDSSSVQGHNIDIINSELYDLASYIKKNYFNGGIIEITNIKKKNFKKFLVQKSSTLIIDGYKIKPLKFDVKQLY